jgi:hypothetical protein
MNFVSKVQSVIEIAPLATRFDMRDVIFFVPVLKKEKGYHSDKAIPEYRIRERRLSMILILIKLP